MLLVSQFSSSEETKDASVRRREPQSAPPGSLPTNPHGRIYETKRTSSTSRMSFKHASAAAAAAAATSAPSTSGTISSNVHLMINSANISFNRLTSSSTAAAKPDPPRTPNRPPRHGTPLVFPDPTDGKDIHTISNYICIIPCS